MPHFFSLTLSHLEQTVYVNVPSSKSSQILECNQDYP